jgi:hypothetical protein
MAKKCALLANLYLGSQATMVDHRTVIGYRTTINYSPLWLNASFFILCLYFQYTMWSAFEAFDVDNWRPNLFIKYFGYATVLVWFFSTAWLVYQEVMTTIRVTLNDREIWIDYVLLMKRKRFAFDELEYFYQTSVKRKKDTAKHLTLVPKAGKEIVVYGESMKDYDRLVQMLMATPIPNEGWSGEAIPE